MVSFAAGGMGPVLILKIPADFDTFAGSGEAIRIEGRYVHWSDAEEIHQMADQIADQLSQAGQFTVQVDLAGGELYPSLESGGFPVMTAVIIFNILAVIGMALVPLLMIEEKEAHTFDAMLVSPARYTQIVAGKALVGLVYCLIAAAVLLTLYNHFFVHWGVVILAVLVTSAFTVALGLLLGIMTDNVATTGVWGGALLLAMISTVVLAAYATPDWPAFVRGLVDWMPGSLMADLFKFAMLRELPYRLLSVSAAALAGMTLGIYLLLAWRVNRWERR
jgi:ABC-type Na+ efflux pump permease subunit